MKVPFFSKKTKAPASTPQSPATTLIPERITTNPETSNSEIGLDDLSLLWRTPEDFNQILGTPKKKS